MLLGLYPSILETDNRLALPDGIQEEYKDGLYITRGFDRNILVLTMEAFKAIYDRITSLNLADPVARLLLRLILGSASQTDVAPDRKLEIPQPLKEFANLERKVFLVGQGDFMELWSSDEWHKQEEKLLSVEAGFFSTLNITTR